MSVRDTRVPACLVPAPQRACVRCDTCACVGSPRAAHPVGQLRPRTFSPAQAVPQSARAARRHTVRAAENAHGTRCGLSGRKIGVGAGEEEQVSFARGWGRRGGGGELRACRPPRGCLAIWRAALFLARGCITDSPATVATAVQYVAVQLLLRARACHTTGPRRRARTR